MRAGPEQPFRFVECGRLFGAILVAVTLVFRPAPASGQWTQGSAGNGWVKTTMLWQRTPTRFDAAGRRRPWLGNGEANPHVMLVDLVLGLRENVDVWLEVAHLNLEFTRRNADTLSRVGLGDLRVWLRWQVARLNGGKTPLALRVGAKAPLGSSPIDAQILPLGEGQWDFEVVGELGHTFAPVPAQAFVWLGYRARLANDETFLDPGGELILYSEVNVRLTSRAAVKGAFDALFERCRGAASWRL